MAIRNKAGTYEYSFALTQSENFLTSANKSMDLPDSTMADITVAVFSLRLSRTNTADGKTMSAVIVTLRVNVRRERSQIATVRSRRTRTRPPVTIGGTNVDVATGVIVTARTEKVAPFPSLFMLMIITYFNLFFYIFTKK